MPIFVYEPDVDSNDLDAVSGRECCDFETLQWANEAPLTQCPECGKSIRRALTSFAATVQNSSDPLKGVSKKLAEGITAGTADTSAAEKSESKDLFSGSNKSPASRAARLAYRHICSGNCRH